MIVRLFINLQNKKIIVMYYKKYRFFLFVFGFVFCYAPLEAAADFFLFIDDSQGEQGYDTSDSESGNDESGCWVQDEESGLEFLITEKLFLCARHFQTDRKKSTEPVIKIQQYNECGVESESEEELGIIIHAERKTALESVLVDRFMQIIRLGDRADICERLLQRGLSVDALIYPNTTLLHWAAWFGRVGVCRVLINAGANIYAKNSSGRTPLHEAAERGFLDCCNVLWRPGDEIDVRADNGATPLFAAAQMHHKNICQFLITHGACAGLKTLAGESPKDYWAVQEVLTELGMFKIIIEQ
ncbi:ankyrin repeat domain-containing protein [Candidatus Babeliales bacterium]|nr:ankyrin repeat domain-containing protein [Candidatus Babeliales bacterium]